MRTPKLLGPTVLAAGLLGLIGLIQAAPAASGPPPALDRGENTARPTLEPPAAPLPAPKRATAPWKPSPDKPSGGEPFAESIEVRVVNVEVFVSDRSGRPVTGLTKDDFELSEDGKPVAITNFYAQSAASAAAGGAPGWTAAETAASAAPGAPAAPRTPASAAAVPESQRLDLGIFIDNLQLTAVARNRVLAAIKDFVASHVTAGDRVLLASFDGSIRIRQAPTRDPKALVAAVDEIARSSPRGIHASQELRNLMQDADRGNTFSGDLEMYVKERYQDDRESLTALDNFVSSLAGLPGRKAVLYVSGGMSMQPDDVGLHAVAEKQGQATVRDLALPGALEIQPLVNHIVAHANASRVTLYGIGAPEDFDSLAVQVGGGTPLGSLQFVARDSLNSVMGPVSQFTGGFSGIDLNDPRSILDRLRGDLETFYSLGFSPTHPTDGGDHKIAVRLKGHKGLSVRTRERYHDRDDAERLTDRTLAALYLGVEDNPLGVKLALERDEPGEKGQRVVSILVAVPADKLVLVPRQGSRDGRFTVFFGTEDAQGRVSQISHKEVPLHIPEARYTAHPGQLATYRIRLAVRAEAQTVAVTLRDDVGKTEAVVAALYHPQVAAAAAAPLRH
jgi:VWFA-related protein